MEKQKIVKNNIDIKVEPKKSKDKSIRFIPIHEMIKKNYTQVVFFDFEMNCKLNSHKDSGNEIISLGAARYKKQNGVEKEKIFYSLVRPTKNPLLTSICRELTGIEQKDIDCARGFNKVMKDFRNWIGDINETLFVSWSDEDIRAINRDYEINQGDRELCDVINSSYADFQLEFSKYLAAKNRVSLKNALKAYNIEFIGHQHNAAYDALNLALLYDAYDRKRKTHI